MNNQAKKKKERFNLIIRWVLYILIMIVSYIGMCITNSTIPDPILLIPVALCIAMWQGPVASALAGCICGLMIDSAMGTVAGYHALMLMWICTVISLMFMFVLRKHFINILIITSVSTVLISALDYLFIYAIWGYDKNAWIFSHMYLPSILMTIIACVPVYYLIKVITVKFGHIKETFIEEKSDDIVRE